MLTECWRHPYEYIYQYRRYVLVATPRHHSSQPWMKFDSHYLYVNPPPISYGRPRGIESPRGSTAATNVTVTSTSPRLMYRYISETEVQL